MRSKPRRVVKLMWLEEKRRNKNPETIAVNVIKITALTTKIGKNNDFGIKLRMEKQKEYLSEN